MTTDAAPLARLPRPGFAAERVLAVASAAAVMTVRLESRFPLGFLFASGLLVDLCIAATVAACLAAVLAPHRRAAMAYAAGLSTMYWCGRGVYFAWAAATGSEDVTYVPTALYGLLAVAIPLFWKRSMERLGFFHALAHQTRPQGEASGRSGVDG